MQHFFGNWGEVMDSCMKKVLDRIQEPMPIVKRPFLEIAEELEMSEERVMAVIEELKSEGYIRRLGGVFNTKRLGYVGTLCAMSVPDEMIDHVAAFINSFDEVTHNYVRRHEYNIWFTVTANSRERIDDILGDISRLSGGNVPMGLPSKRMFKVKTYFASEGGTP
jgi:siroheme decarboxylase